MRRFVAPALAGTALLIAFAGSARAETVRISLDVGESGISVANGQGDAFFAWAEGAYLELALGVPEGNVLPFEVPESGLHLGDVASEKRASLRIALLAPARCRVRRRSKGGSIQAPAHSIWSRPVGCCARTGAPRASSMPCWPDGSPGRKGRSKREEARSLDHGGQTQPTGSPENPGQFTGTLGIDPGRIGLFACSGHVPTALWLLMEQPHGSLACAALCYGYMLDLGESRPVAEAAAKFGFGNPAANRSVGDLPRVPILLARAGRDQLPGVNESIDGFAAEALARNLPLTLINLAEAPHAFDLFDESEASREAVRAILAFLRAHLLGATVAPVST
jgi:hypothetical protein